MEFYSQLRRFNQISDGTCRYLLRRYDMRSGSMVNSSVTATEDFWHILVDMTDGSYATGLEKLAQVQHSAFDNAT